ncbi:polynucleotide 5'-hydroxyl-kinase NOL9-like [Mya arenaria]|uniref:polynucleotide 5'-hydroxyl-kinase NOL9-like n=1 Tax=Mya arenaria TaxID=6604 RepID=UPI0022E77A99|nr:polynucleotide 5'-hydroxyl-kinase NOL9-like [Mya arenaria]XP_052779861.1 polynucleotide 5'-hydroxyl-kinase NOL9-like [Mya arenaria]
MKGKKKNKLKGKPMPVKGNQETKLHVDLKLEKEPTAKKRKQSSEVENDEVSAARKKAKTASEMTKKNLKDMPVTDSKKEEKKKAKSAFEMTKKSEKHMPVTDLDKRRENKAKSAFEIRKKSVTETKNEELRLETAVSKNKKKKKKKSGKNSPAAVNRIEKNSPAAVNRNEKNSPAAVNRNEKNSPAAVNRNVERSRKSPRKQGMIKKTKEDKEASVATSRNDDTIESIWGRIMKGNKANSIKEMQGEKKDGGFTQVSESNKRSKQKGKVDNELAKTGSDVALSGNVNLVSEINEASETVGKGKKKRKKNQADAEDDTKVKKLKGSDKDISDKCFQGDFVLDNHNIASSSKDGAEMGPDVDEAIVDLSETSLTELDEISVKRPVALEFGKSVLVIMNHPMEVPIRGRARVCGIMGTATSMGYDIKPGKPAAEIYSPASNSLVTIATQSGENDVGKAMKTIGEMCNEVNVTKGKAKLMASLRKVLEIENEFVILKFDKIQTNMCKFMSSFFPYSSIFKLSDDQSFLSRKLLPLEVIMPCENTDLPTIQTSQKLNSMTASWESALKAEVAPVMVVCGGKNSGKSTTNRILMNVSLNSVESLYYLECDIGQTEFTPSGVVALYRVTAPVIGPPFCHQRKPVCAYFYGGVSPRDDPDQYLRCVQMCVKTYQQIEGPKPLIVNTMGWMKGLGWQLFVDTVRWVRPSHIVQLTSHNKHDNIDPLSFPKLNSYSWSDLSQNKTLCTLPRFLNREPKIIHIDETISPSHDFKLTAADYRNLSILSHLGNDLEPGLTLTSVTPFEIAWRNVCVHVCSMEVQRSQIMYALNASLVGLCKADISQGERYYDEGPVFMPPDTIFQWIGFGIVRAIDPEQKLFYIVTSLSEEELGEVNSIVKGGVTLPEYLLTLQKQPRLVYADEVVSTIGIHCKKRRKRLTRQNQGKF